MDINLPRRLRAADAQLELSELSGGGPLSSGSVHHTCAATDDLCGTRPNVFLANAVLEWWFLAGTFSSERPLKGIIESGDSYRAIRSPQWPASRDPDLTSGCLNPRPER